MAFKINNISVKISFSFFALILFFIITDNINIYFITLTCALFHEMIHIISIYLLGGKIDEISFSAFGGNIKRSNDCFLGYIKEAVVNISAPLFNILIGLLLFKSTDILNQISQINLVLGIFNILPFFSFDGGHFIDNLLSIVFSSETVNVFLTILSVIITALFAVVGVIIYYNYNENITLIIFSVFCFLSILFKK